MANPNPVPRPENLQPRPPWPKGTSGNPAGYSRKSRAIDELRAVQAAGGAAIVDLTLGGMGRRLAEIPRVSRESGVAICVGCGWYVEELHPPEIAGLSVEELAVMLLAELRDGIEDTGIRPALIGEIGTRRLRMITSA